MNVLRVLSVKTVFNRASLQEEYDIWCLYHLLHYYERCGGREIKVPRPEQVSYRVQYQKVHFGVNKQVIALLEPDLEMIRSFFLSCTSKNGSTGVWLHGKAVPGTVLCFYPGVVYLPLYLDKMPNFPDVSKGNPYLMSRTDGCIIDAKDVMTRDMSTSPLALGHLLRHPPKGLQPNVVPFSYYIGNDLPSHLLRYVPNRYFRTPFYFWLTCIKMHCIVFVATRHIQDEELFLNYRLHPDSDLPADYYPVDPEEDRLRWK